MAHTCRRSWGQAAAAGSRRRPRPLRPRRWQRAPRARTRRVARPSLAAPHRHRAAGLAASGSWSRSSAHLPVLPGFTPANRPVFNEELLDYKYSGTRLENRLASEFVPAGVRGQLSGLPGRIAGLGDALLTLPRPGLTRRLVSGAWRGRGRNGRSEAPCVVHPGIDVGDLLYGGD